MSALAFLAPLFLVGLGFLVWPVLVHLVQKDRKEVVEFPSLMFLERVPYKSSRRQKIRHWLLLLIRLAALTALIAAFARPFMDRDDIALGGTVVAREVVILVDRSYSMDYGDRWTDALAGARAAVRQLGPEDRASLVFFSAGATLAVRSTTDRTVLFAALDTVEPGAGATRFGPALDLARTVLEQSNLPGRHAVVISDFQRAGWDGDEGARLPPGTTVDPVVVTGPYEGDLAVGQLLFQRSFRDGLERVETTARLVNSGDREAEDVEVVLELDGRPAGSAAATLGPNATTLVTLPPFTLSEPFMRGSVRVPGDALPANDVVHFVLSPGEGFSVLVVEDGSDPRDPSLYLDQALAIGTDPAFDVDGTTVGAMTAGDLAGRSVVILNGSRPPRGGVGTRLREFVEDGGGLVVILGERSSWPADGPDLLPGPVGAVMEPEWREGRGGTLGRIDYTHPVFALFAAPRSGDLTDANFFRYRNVEFAGAEGVLARFDNGAVALAERQVGEGRVLLWTSMLDNYWNDMVLQPIFLPFAHQLVKHAGSFRPPTASYTVDDVLNLSGQGGGGEGDRLLAGLSLDNGDGLVALSPANRSIDVGGAARPGFLPLSEQGFYELRGGGAGGGPGTPAVAVNVNLGEADLEAMDPEEFAGSITSPDIGEAGAIGAELGPEDRERRQGIWWYLLVAAFLLLALETIVSNYLSRKAASQPWEGSAASS